MATFKDLAIERQGELLEAVTRYAMVPDIRPGDLVLLVEFGRMNGMTIGEIAKSAGIAAGSLNHALVKDRRGVTISSLKFYNAIARGMLAAARD